MWQLVEKIAEYSAKMGLRWTSPVTGFFISLLFGLIAAGGSGALLGSSRLELVACFSLSSLLFGFLLWRFSCRVPKSPDGYIGVAIALESENEEERKRVKRDFIVEIAGALEHAASSIPFKVIEIPSYLAPDVNDQLRAAELLIKCKYHLLIWGSVRTRKQAGKDLYIVRLEGVVTHSSVEEYRSKALASEMRMAIPRQTEISLANELRGFESASQSVALAAKYIVALAAAVSRDWTLSKTTLLELISIVGKPAAKKSKKNRGTGVKTGLDSKLPQYLAQVYYAEALSFFDEWRNDRGNINLLLNCEKSLEDYRALTNQIGKEGPPYWILKASLSVTIRNDFDTAESLLNRCRASAINDPIWRLSLAFIQMVRGNVLSAIQMYDAALEREVPISEIFQVEEYVQWWIEKNDGPDGLYLLSAFLNAKAKLDPQLALKDLDAYENKTGASLSQPIRERVERIRAEIKTQI